MIFKVYMFVYDHNSTMTAVVSDANQTAPLNQVFDQVPPWSCDFLKQ